MFRVLPLSILLVAGTASATEFESEQAELAFQGIGTALDSVYDIPIGVNLDIVIVQFWVGVTLSLRGNGAFGLYVEGTSDLKWDNEDGLVGAVYHAITPLDGSGLAGLDAFAALRVSFDIRNGGPTGSSFISFVIFSQDIQFGLDSDPFSPWLLPGSSPASQTLSTTSSDLAFRLPLQLVLPILNVVEVTFGPVITGFPQTTAVFGGNALGTQHGTDIVLAGGEIYLYEQAPEVELISAYSAYVNTIIAYVFNVTLDFSIDILGFGLGNISIPLYNQAFPLFSDSVDLLFPTERYVHPTPMITVPDQQITFQKVQLGNEKQFQLIIQNDGNLELEGTVELEADAQFSVQPSTFGAAAGGQTSVSVYFAPEVTGDYQGVVRLISNDPVAEVIEIPIVARAVKPVSDDGGPGTDGGGFTDNGSGLYQTCGCSSTEPTSGTWAMLGVAGLMLARRRRTV